MVFAIRNSAQMFQDSSQSMSCPIVGIVQVIEIYSLFPSAKSEKLPGDETSITMVDRWHQCIARQTSEYSMCISMVYPTFFYGQLDFLSCSASFQWLQEAALQ